MHEQHPSQLPWLDRMAVHIPGYGGYLRRGHRRAADQALRDAIARQLRAVKTHLEQATLQCLDRQALTEINALERVGRHLDRVAERVHSAGSGSDTFYQAGDLPPDKADPLHAADLELYQLADAVARRFELPDNNHDRLAEIEAGLRQIEVRLDQRALMLQGIR